ncbi:abscisic acid aba receptor [Seiridium cupressi]
MAHATPHHHRFFANPQEPLTAFDAHQELLASLERINISNPPVHTCSTGWSFHGAYTGPTSIAYLFHRISQVYPDLKFKQQSLLDWAREYLGLGNSLSTKDPTPSHCGIANETLAHSALSAVIKDDASFARKLCSYEAAINSTKEDGSNEWLYGRAGYLYYLRLCRLVFSEESDPDTADLLEKTIDKTVQRILTVPQPWTWHGKRYLGSVHGTIGIICQSVLSMPSAAPRFQNLLSELLDMQFESGNFPSSLPIGSDKLVQFCHGGPGFVLSLRSLRPHFPALEEKIQQGIARAQIDILERGFLRKEPSLCHGIASNGLAVDNDKQFEVFLSCMTTDSMKKLRWTKEKGHGDDIVSLYTGEAGRAWVWAVADKGLARTCIGYNDL